MVTIDIWWGSRTHRNRKRENKDNIPCGEGATLPVTWNENLKSSAKFSL